MDNRIIMQKLLKLNLLRRYHMRKVSQQIGIYFGQPPILEILNEKGCMTQKELADSLHVSAPSIATSVKRMSKSGLVEKQADSTDMRCTSISLTEKGKALNKMCREKFDEMDELALNGLDENRREEFASMIDTMIKNLSTDDINGKSVFQILNEFKEGEKENDAI